MSVSRSTSSSPPRLSSKPQVMSTQPFASLEFPSSESLAKEQPNLNPALAQAYPFHLPTYLCLELIILKLGGKSHVVAYHGVTWGYAALSTGLMLIAGQAGPSGSTFLPYFPSSSFYKGHFLSFFPRYFLAVTAIPWHKFGRGVPRLASVKAGRNSTQISHFSAALLLPWFIFKKFSWLRALANPNLSRRRHLLVQRHAHALGPPLLHPACHLRPGHPGCADPRLGSQVQVSWARLLLFQVTP